MSANEDTPDGKDGYEVGYGKPPKEHQFQNGNKLGKGQKKGAKALKTIVKEAAGQKVMVKQGGKIKKITLLELTIQQLVAKASKGDFKAAGKFISLAEMYLPQEEAGEPDAETQMADIDALKAFIALQDEIEPPQNDGEKDTSD